MKMNPFKKYTLGIVVPIVVLTTAGFLFGLAEDISHSHQGTYDLAWLVGLLIGAGIGIIIAAIVCLAIKFD